MGKRQLLRSLVRRCRQHALRLRAACARPLPLSIPSPWLIACAHPDDETFGCGGLIRQATDAGKEVSVLFLTRGEGSHMNCCRRSKAVAEHRRLLADKACAQLGLPAERLLWRDEPDGRLAEGGAEGIGLKAVPVARLMQTLRPGAVFAPHPLEGWSDHVAAEQIVREAIRQGGWDTPLYHYCVWFWMNLPFHRALRMDWRRAAVLDIGGVYRHKRAAMDTYLRTHAPCGHPWVGALPGEFVSAFTWRKELFFLASGAGE